MRSKFETLVIYLEKGKNLASSPKVAVKFLNSGEVTYPESSINYPNEQNLHDQIVIFNEAGWELVGTSDGFYMSREVEYSNENHRM